MKILYVLPETPFTGGGGIATYLGHAALALTKAGHEVFVLSWTFAEGDRPEPRIELPFDAARVRILPIEGARVWDEYPSGPWQVAFSHFIAQNIVDFVREIRPDVIETSDYLFPMFGYLMRRRAGLLPDIALIPVVAYNHGSDRGIYRAAAQFPTPLARQEIAAQRTMLRWCDQILFPSTTASIAMERQIGFTTQASLVREPYYQAADEARADVSVNRYTYLGRVGFAKGIDGTIHFLNVLSSFAPIDEISVIGGLQHTTFKAGGVEAYIRTRLKTELHSKLNLTGAMKRSEVDRLMRAGGFSLNFSRSETFSYSFLEQLEGGLLPFTRKSTAMAEFYPDELEGLLLPPDFDLTNLPAIYSQMQSNADEILERIRSHARALTSPSHFVDNYERVCANLVENAARNKSAEASLRRVSTGQDVSILIPTYNPGKQLISTLATVANQSSPPKEIIILDDGSCDAESLGLLAAVDGQESVRVVRSRANEGLCATRNKLVRECKTEFAIFLDDDDQLESTYISDTLHAMNNSPVHPDAVVTWRKNIGESTEVVINYNVDDYEHFFSNDLRMTGLIRTSALQALPFAASLRNGEADDWDFWLRFKAANFKIICLPALLFLYRFRYGSMSWPWSEGQAALTADLVSDRLVAAFHDKALPDDALAEMVSIQHQLQRHGSSPSGGGAAHMNAPERYGYIQAARRRHPIAGGALAMIYRVVTGAAKRLSK